MASKRETDRTEQEDQLLELLRKLAGSRGGDVNDTDQEYTEPTANENYGYVNKPGFMDFAKFVPGPLGTAAKVTSGMMNQGNNQAVRRAREAMGLPNEKPSFVKDVMKGPKNGKIADVGIAGKNYPVGFEAQDANKKTTLTPNEARMRGLANGGMTENKTPQKETIMDKLSRNVFGKQDDMDEPDQGTNHLHAGLGLAETPDGFRAINDPDLPARDMANVQYDLDGKGRSQVPTSGIQNKVSDVVTDLLGPDYGVRVTSGMEPEGARPVGTAHRHPGGFAADLEITDPQGRPLSLSDPQGQNAIRDVAQGMAARYGANFGMGPEYMGDKTMHIDTMDLDKYPGGPEWASKGKEWAGMLDEARATGVMPSQYYDVANPPTPSARPSSAMIAEQDTETPTDGRFSFANNYQPSQKNTVTVDPNRFKDISDDEKSLMGMTLAGEIDPSKTDLTTEGGRREAMGILSTIENRAPKYGGIEGAITAPKQYSTWNNEAAANTAANNYHGNKSTYDTLVSDYISNPQNNLGFTSYHANYVNPGWSSAMQNPETIGPHTFGFISDYTSEKPAVTPHTVFNTSAAYAPNMTGMVSEVNADRGKSLSSTVASKPSSMTQTSSTQETRETSSSSRGFGSGNSGTGGSSSMSSGSGSSKPSGMTGTSMNSGKDKDDKASSGFSGGRSY